MQELIKQPNKAQVNAFNNTFTGLLSMKGVSNIQTAQSKILTALSIADKTLLPLCKAFAIVKDKQLFLQPTQKNGKGYAKYEKWATDELGKGRSTAYNYAKVGAFVDDNGFNTIFAEKDESDNIIADFDYYGLLALITACTVKDGKEFNHSATLNKILSVIKDGTIVVGMDAKNIEKVLKPRKGQELTEQPSEQPSEQPTPQPYDTLDTVRKSALYLNIEPMLARAVSKALNDNDNSITRVIDELIELTNANELEPNQD